MDVEVFGRVEENIESFEKEFGVLDEIGNTRDLEQKESDQKKCLMGELWVAQRNKESMWKQKLRKKWVKERDKNKKFFQINLSLGNIV